MSASNMLFEFGSGLELAAAVKDRTGEGGFGKDVDEAVDDFVKVV